MDKITYFGGDHEVKENNNWPDYCKSFGAAGFDEKEYSYDQFSWPPRHYTCTFCRRKFKSAQALGGHMNVHRRDRAMLRHPPSWVFQKHTTTHPSNPNPTSNSSPNHHNRGFMHSSMSSSSSSSSSSSVSTSSTSLSHLADNISALPQQPYYTYKPKSLMMPPYLAKQRFPSNGLKEFGREEDEFKVMKNGQLVGRLDLELGLVRSKVEDLDLELRLGYTT